MKTFIINFKNDFNQFNTAQKVAYVTLMIIAFIFIISMASLLSGVLAGTPSGDNIPFV